MRADEFWDYADKTISGDGCWIFTYNFNPDVRYKTLRIDKKHYLAHRYAYESAYGPIPPGMVICHTCDNVKCVNPAHLWMGTQQDNMNDKIRKGHQTSGDTHGLSKLTQAQADEMRTLYASGRFYQRELADMFKVALSTVNAVILRRNWK